MRPADSVGVHIDEIERTEEEAEPESDEPIAESSTPLALGREPRMRRVPDSDSQSAIHLAKNLAFHSRTKHIEVKYHFIRQLLEKKMLQLKKVRGDRNPAEMLTKAGRGVEVVHESPGRAYLMFTLMDPSEPMYCMLGPSGTLEERTWSDEKGSWVVTWQSTQIECESYNRCGSFGRCSTVMGQAACSCFPGFEPRDRRQWERGNWSGGCVRRTGLVCGNEMRKGDGFVKMERVKLPDNGRWFARFDEECGRDCLDCCSCVTYALVKGMGCIWWSEDLIDVQELKNGGSDLYVRLALSELGKSKHRTLIIIVTLVVLGVVITILVCAYCQRKVLLKFTVKVEEFKLFKFQMLSNATSQFDPGNKLGQGGFGPVYRGKLPNGQEIAVKRLARSSHQGQEEFLNEVQVISKLQHRNLVRLLGCCAYCEENMLVYEYLPNGSLDAYIFGSRKREFLDWQTRANIIEGICRGLLYLHRDSRLRIIHRDLKASNILLDTNLNPKISDFGTARIYCGKEDQAAKTKRVVGTYGYMSPEYALHGMFSEKSDVYSFGVLILEILSGKSASFYHEEQQMFLIAYAWKLWNEEKILDFVDPLMTYADPFKETDVARYANVGLLCVQETAVDRPGISNILSMLSCEISELPRPKQPAFVAVQRLSETRLGRESPSQCSVNDVTVTVVEGR
ncbi:G-type lectin S-receptor-like serine/threonine-protein kinase [Striga hermonthica]|uniref:non-specific serine/threonine protein kinase n=1 Tax=Striga hermonthica TaxID=68872 RepID=A0A9N7N7V7_STRHE|nr:G-type lectin S-receptor-like serine/threonine-protein kinase [Striga hermonthica]